MPNDSISILTIFMLLLKVKQKQSYPWRRGLVVLSPPATKETGAMGREIESLQGMGVAFKKVF
jgi:hypothetical protein